jgi:GTP cyclohydrolase II
MEFIMSIMQKFINYISNNNRILHSKTTNISTRYGMFQSKSYKDSKLEYLAIMSNDFSSSKKPIIYIHSDIYGCDTDHSEGCYCNNQMQMALKMIYKEGGLILYYSPDISDINGLLEDINARNFNSQKNIMSELKENLDGNVFRSEYYTLATIFKNLNLSSAQVITSNRKILMVLRAIKVDIIKSVLGISFEYGNEN